MAISDSYHDPNTRADAVSAMLYNPHSGLTRTEAKALLVAIIPPKIPFNPNPDSNSSPENTSGSGVLHSMNNGTDGSDRNQSSKTQAHVLSSKNTNTNTNTSRENKEKESVGTAIGHTYESMKSSRAHKREIKKRSMKSSYNNNNNKSHKSQFGGGTGSSTKKDTSLNKTLDELIILVHETRRNSIMRGILQEMSPAAVTGTSVRPVRFVFISLDKIFKIFIILIVYVYICSGCSRVCLFLSHYSQYWLLVVSVSHFY